MSRPRALDLFCGAGGAAMGLYRAGFDVVGVDIKPQPRYPFAFVRGDALRPPFDLAGFDLIWASPPCQEYVNAGLRALAAKNRRPDTPRKPMLIEPVRAMLAASGASFTAIENVPSAPLRPDLLLDGDMFGLNTFRQRVFELSFFALQSRPNVRFGPESRPGAVTLAGRGSGERAFYDNGRLRRCRAGNKSSWSAAIGVDWMTRDELREAIPPAYSEFIGRAALAQLRTERAA